VERESEQTALVEVLEFDELVRDVEERLLLEAVVVVDVDVPRLVDDESAVGVFVCHLEGHRCSQPIGHGLQADDRPLADELRGFGGFLAVSRLTDEFDIATHRLGCGPQ